MPAPHTPTAREITASVIRLPIPQRMQLIREVAEAIDLPSHGVDLLLEGADLIEADWEDCERQPWPETLWAPDRQPYGQAPVGEYAA